ncbi:MAG: DNA-directed RNA polymerase subunit K [Candidatus Anstonellales archaeon]
MKYNKFEIARIVGARAFQLALGSPPLIKVKPEQDFIEIAKEEFEKGVIPLSVRKTSLSGSA